jgi:hypothetical protein
LIKAWEMEGEIDMKQSELRSAIEEIISDSVETIYGWDGEDETRTDSIDSSSASFRIIRLLIEKGIIKEEPE